MHSALIIENEAGNRRLIAALLRAQGFKVWEESGGIEAQSRAVRTWPDLFILETVLPDMDGIELITQLRIISQSPIIVVSSRTGVYDRITALDAGADDYLTKPFSTEELLARVRAVLRRCAGNSADTTEDLPVFQNGNIRIDFSSGCVYRGGEEVHLTPIEFKLLSLLAKNVGKVLTHQYIFQNVWNGEQNADQQSLRVFMASLRKKLEPPGSPKLLQTHVGVGYRLLRHEPETERKRPFVIFTQF